MRLISIQKLRTSLNRADSFLGQPNQALLFSRFFLGQPKTVSEPIGKTLDKARNILVIRLDEIGDVLLTTPFVRELKRKYPQAKITMMVKKKAAELLETNPWIDKVISYDPGLPNTYLSLTRHKKDFLLTRNLFENTSFDVAIVPRWDRDFYNASFLSLASRAPVRIGFGKSKLFYNRGNFIARRQDPNANLHEVKKSQVLLKSLGVDTEDLDLELDLLSADKDFADSFLLTKGRDTTKRLISIACGARLPYRVWPIAHFIDVALFLEKNFNAQIILIGGADSESLSEKMVNQVPQAINASGRVNLRQSAALIAKSDLFIGNDSAPMHLAAAVKIPVIEISSHAKNCDPTAATSPERFSPWNTKSIVIRPEKAISPCGPEHPSPVGCCAEKAHCISQISPEQVFDAIKKILA